MYYGYSSIPCRKTLCFNGSVVPQELGAKKGWKTQQWYLCLDQDREIMLYPSHKSLSLRKPVTCVSSSRFPEKETHICMLYGYKPSVHHFHAQVTIWAQTNNRKNKNLTDLQ